MLPAKVPITHPQYGGPVLTNTGGPGVPSTTFVITSSAILQPWIETPGKPSLIQDNDSSRYFDIVGIDPRGVGFSLPTASCFETDLQRAEWNLRMAAAGIVGSSDNAVADNWARKRAYGLACHNLSESKDPADNIMPFITTASTARD